MNFKQGLGLLTLVCVIFFFIGNGVVELTNPDEVFYAQTAREMITHHSWSVPYLFDQPQFEKPILTYVLLKIAFLAGGVTNSAARFFPSLFAMFGVFLVFYLVWFESKDALKAFFCGLVLASSGLYIGLARTVFTDMIFSIWILAALVSFFRAYRDPSRKTAGVILFYIFMALAVLTKGLLGMVLPLATVCLFLFFEKNIRFILCRASVAGGVLFCLLAVPWYAAMIHQYGNAFIHEFFVNDHWRRIMEAEHASNDRWYFYPVSVIGGMFPWSLYAAAAVAWGMSRIKNTEGQARTFYRFLLTWIFTVLLILQIAHSKLVSYVFPLVPALAVLTGEFIWNALTSSKQRLILVFSLIQALIILVLPVAIFMASIRYPEYSPPLFSKIIFAGICVFMSFSIFNLIRSQRWLTAHLLISCVVPMLLCFAFLSHNIYRDFVSSRAAGQYLKTQGVGSRDAVLASKFFVRGVRFFSGAEVAAMDINGKGFFSPHPIPFINREDLLVDFLREKEKVFVVLKKGDWEHMLRVTKQQGMTCLLLERYGDEFIGRVD